MSKQQQQQPQQLPHQRIGEILFNKIEKIVHFLVLSPTKSFCPGF
jgi:hypothetical protein